MSDRPNVLLIVLDQMRADILHGRLAAAANLKSFPALMEECTVFRQHFTVTTPCGPSRISLLTGQYAMNHRSVRNGTPLSHDTPNIAREMGKAGYEPLLFGYTDTTQDPRALPPDDPRLESYEEVMSGFTEAVRMRQESDDEVWRDHLRAKGYEVPDDMALYVPDGDHFTSPARYRAEDSDTAFLTDKFIERMSGEASGWFAMLAYVRPHPPFVAPAPYNLMYEPNRIPPAVMAHETEWHPYFRANRAARPMKNVVQGFPDLKGTAEEVQQMRALYYGLVAELDLHIGRVVAWLKASGQWDDTILLLTSDHGEMLGDHGLWGKDTYYDAAMHVPLMVRVPGAKPSEINGFSESVDVMPTILDLVGQPIPHSVDGISLAPWIESGSGGKPLSYSEHDFGKPHEPSVTQRELGLDADASNFAILRTPTHRFVHFAADLPQIVFDLNGEGEMLDISGLPGGLEICLDLSRKMLCHRMVNPEGTFAKTIVADGGIKIGTS